MSTSINLGSVGDVGRRNGLHIRLTSAMNRIEAISQTSQPCLKQNKAEDRNDFLTLAGDDPTSYRPLLRISHVDQDKTYHYSIDHW